MAKPVGVIAEETARHVGPGVFVFCPDGEVGELRRVTHLQAFSARQQVRLSDGTSCPLLTFVYLETLTLFCHVSVVRT